MLKGRQTLLRALEPTDLDILYKWENNIDNWNLSGTLTPYSRFVIEQYLAASHQDIYYNKQLRLMIDKTDGEKETAIGCIDLFDLDPFHKRAGVGILIGEKENRKKGYGKEALQLLTEYAFDKLDMHQLFANIAADNVSSLEMFKKCGFVMIGIKKEWLNVNGSWNDECLLQLIKPE
ncbi:MAG: GNAT family N-acetyltransferase [Bacteroidia bacterium]